MGGGYRLSVPVSGQTLWINITHSKQSYENTISLSLLYVCRLKKNVSFKYLISVYTLAQGT